MALDFPQKWSLESFQSAVNMLPFVYVCKAYLKMSDHSVVDWTHISCSDSNLTAPIKCTLSAIHFCHLRTPHSKSQQLESILARISKKPLVDNYPAWQKSNVPPGWD